MAAKASFVTLRNNANFFCVCENGAADMIFFHQKMRNWYLGNSKKKKKRRKKKKWRKIFTSLNRRHEKRNNGSKLTPLYT